MKNAFIRKSKSAVVHQKEAKLSEKDRFSRAIMSRRTCYGLTNHEKWPPVMMEIISIDLMYRVIR